MKTCPTCSLEKVDTEFKYGYKSCKKCLHKRYLPLRLKWERDKVAANPKRVSIPRQYNDMGQLTHKRCSMCREILSVDTFNLHIRHKDGYNNCCKLCAQARWREKIDERRIPYLLTRCRKTARDQNLPFDLSPEDITIPTHCPVLGIVLEFGKTSEKAWRDNSPSLDRIVPEKGYVRDNVLVVSYRANRIKNDATISELQQIAAFYKTYGH